MTTEAMGGDISELRWLRSEQPAAPSVVLTCEAPTLLSDRREEQNNVLLISVQYFICSRVYPWLSW